LEVARREGERVPAAVAAVEEAREEREGEAEKAMVVEWAQGFKIFLYPFGFDRSIISMVFLV
jgi:hypothetical protein